MNVRERVYAVLTDGAWHSEEELTRRCRTASPGAWARDLRKPQFGGFRIQYRRLNGTAEYRLDPDSITPEGASRVGKPRSSALQEAAGAGAPVSRPLNRGPIVRWLSSVEDGFREKPLGLYQKRLGLVDALIRFEYLEPLTLTVWLREKGWKVERESFTKRWLSPPPELMQKEHEDG